MILCHGGVFDSRDKIPSPNQEEEGYSYFIGRGYHDWIHRLSASDNTERKNAMAATDERHWTKNKFME